LISKKSFPLKTIGQMNRNLVGSILGRYCIKIGIYWWYICVLGVSTGDIFVCWGYLPVVYLCVEGIYRWYICVLGVSTGDIFVCWGYLPVIYLCVVGIYWWYICVLWVSTGDIFVC
jgi:hypothetical protein